ncbi:MAG: ribosome maturation factor RimP [Candidatus Omnitrophota bacterium]
MDYKTSTEELKKIVMPSLEEEGLELIELNFVRTGDTSLVRLLVDKKEGGINLGDCARLNQKIGAVLENNEILQGRFILEVFSPGLDRPLKTKGDFLRCINKNKNVKFFLREQINGKIEQEGVVIDVQDEAVVIENKDGNLLIPLSIINKAKQII